MVSRAAGNKIARAQADSFIFCFCAAWRTTALSEGSSMISKETDFTGGIYPDNPYMAKAK